MLTIILSALAGAAGMGAAVRWVRPVRDLIVPNGSGGPGPNPPPQRQ